MPTVRLALPTKNHPDSRRRNPTNMARLKRKSPALQVARERLAGLKKFRTEPDFGPALSVPAYETEINGYAADETSYNQDPG